MTHTSIVEGTESRSSGRRIAVSESAARRIRQIIEKEGRPDGMFRVSVSGGGCSGFQYHFAFDEAVQDDDVIFERDGVRVLVDEMSLELLDGSEIDFKEELVGSYFAVQNPNATTSCGCGSSFSI